MGCGSSSWRPFSNGIDVISAVASVLAVRPRADGSLLNAVCEAIADRRLLVVLDNCEHVPDAVREVVTAIG